jgi:TRAP-type mannitol/chloroaromatic compound transport system substrate-binding protein
MEELASQDETAKRIYKSYKSFQNTMLDYKLVSEEAFDDARRL